VPNPSPTAVHRVAAVLSRLLFVGTLVGVAVVYGDVPDRVPHHFGLSGEPDAWGGRGWLWALPALQLLLILFLGGMRRALPALAAWDGGGAPHEPSLRLGGELVVLCELLVVGAMALGSLEQVALARGEASPVGGWLGPALLAGLAVVVVVELVRMRVATRRAADQLPAGHHSK